MVKEVIEGGREGRGGSVRAYGARVSIPKVENQSGR